MEKVVYQQEPLANYWLIEIPVPAQAVTSVAIPTQNWLRSTNGKIVIIKSLELVTAKTLAKAPVSGATNATLAELLKASLTLYSDGWERLQYVPLLRLNSLHDSDSAVATTIPFTQEVQKTDFRSVEWEKSKINFNGASSGSAYSILIGIQYLVVDGQGKVIKP